jgi:hypothetical protein
MATALPQCWLSSTQRPKDGFCPWWIQSVDHCQPKDCPEKVINLTSSIYHLSLHVVSYAARDYYEPNASRPNLSVLTEALVAKIEFEKGGSGDVTATGVKILVNGATHTVKANKEVIVAGGVVNSPQILELSGIGSPSVLKKAGVDLVVDNPYVGENLNDHSATGVTVVSTSTFNISQEIDLRIFRVSKTNFQQQRSFFVILRLRSKQWKHTLLTKLVLSPIHPHVLASSRWI